MEKRRVEVLERAILELESEAEMTIIDKKIFNRLKRHAGDIGVWIKLVGDKVQVRCYARTHGGRDMHLLTVRKSAERNEKTK